MTTDASKEDDEREYARLSIVYRGTDMQKSPLFVDYVDTKRQIADMDNALRDLNDAISIMKAYGADASYFLTKRRQIRTAREKLVAGLPHWEQATLKSNCDLYRHFES